MSQHPRQQSPSTPPRSDIEDYNLSFAPARRERSFFQRRRNPFNVAIPFNFPPAMHEEIQHRRPEQQSPSTPPGGEIFNNNLSFAPARRERSFLQQRNPLNNAIPINFSPEEIHNRRPELQSPSTPPENYTYDDNLSFAPARRERSFLQRRNPLNLAIPLNFSPEEIHHRQPSQQSPSTPPRLHLFQELPLRPARRSRVSLERNRSRVAIPFNISPPSSQEIRLQRFRELQRMRSNNEEEDLADPLEDRILNQMNERKEGRQKHAERLNRARGIRQAGGFMNMRENVKIRHQKAPNYFEQYNRNKLKRLIDLAAAAGAVKKAARPRNLVFPSSPEEREQVRNQLALRQIQKLKREGGEISQENSFLIPLAENLESDETENEENSMLEKEIKISVKTFCQGYQRMSQRGMRPDFIFKNLKQSLENIFDNIYLIRTRYRGAAFREDKLLRQNLISEIIVYFATSPPYQESLDKMIEIFKKLR